MKRLVKKANKNNIYNELMNLKNKEMKLVDLDNKVQSIIGKTDSFYDGASLEKVDKLKNKMQDYIGQTIDHAYYYDGYDYFNVIAKIIKVDGPLESIVKVVNVEIV